MRRDKGVVLQYGRSSREGCVACGAELKKIAAEGRENLGFCTKKSEKSDQKAKISRPCGRVYVLDHFCGRFGRNL